MRSLCDSLVARLNSFSACTLARAFSAMSNFDSWVFGKIGCSSDADVPKLISII